jgi:hypothetical protein
LLSAINVPLPVIQLNKWRHDKKKFDVAMLRREMRMLSAFMTSRFVFITLILERDDMQIQQR